MKNIKLKDEAYLVFKWILFTFVPALVLLISTLGTIYHFDTKYITLTIGAVATFLGAITGISNKNYYKGDE